MTATSAAERERLLDEVVASYLQALDAGRVPDRQDLLDRNPQIATELQAFFIDQDQLNRFGARPRAGSEPGPNPTDRGAATGDLAVTDAIFLHPASASRHALQPGSVLAGAYEIFDVKAGGMGRVFLADDLNARQNDIELKVAIKSVVDFDEWQAARQAKGAACDEAQYASLVARFHREALAWVRLGKHDNIILAIMVIEVGAKPYLVMEYADSGDLHTWIQEQRLTVPLAVNFALQFCQGMQYAVRAANMVHRDIKPANVLIKGDRLLKIADFGLAKAFADDEEHLALGMHPGMESSLSVAGWGSRPYMSPEQFESLSRADTRSDVYSFGAMFYEMLTSQRLFKAGNDAEHYVLRRKPIPRAHEVNPLVPPILSGIIERCVAYDPGQRYLSFDELFAHLAQVDASLPERLPIPRDDHKLPPEFFTPTIQILGEAYSLVSLGHYEAAARRAQQGIDVDPGNAAHWINKGKALAELKDFQGARKCAQKATELRIVDAAAWANLGWCTLTLGDAAAALAEATRATRLDDRFADAWICRGACERALGRMDEAVSSLQRAAKLESHNWKAHSNLGFCLAEQGRHAEALAALQAASAINPNDALVWYKIAWLLAAEGDFQEARRAIDASLKLIESDADAWGLRGLILWQAEGDAAVAWACLNKAFELDPHNEKARRVLEILPRSG